MNGALAKYQGPETAVGMMTVEEQLKLRRKALAGQLEETDKAIEVLEAQPQLLETLNILRKVGI